MLCTVHGSQRWARSSSAPCLTRCRPRTPISSRRSRSCLMLRRQMRRPVRPIRYRSSSPLAMLETRGWRNRAPGGTGLRADDLEGDRAAPSRVRSTQSGRARESRLKAARTCFGYCNSPRRSEAGLGAARRRERCMMLASLPAQSTGDADVRRCRSRRHSNGPRGCTGIESVLSNA